MTAQPGRIELERSLRHAPSLAWTYLTDPAKIAAWWAPCDLVAEVGHSFHFDMGPWGKQPCEVVAVDPDHLLAIAFAKGTLDTTVTWTLLPEGDGTLLRMVHEGFDLESPMAKMAFEGMSNGWPAILDRLASTVGS